MYSTFRFRCWEHFWITCSQTVGLFCVLLLPISVKQRISHNLQHNQQPVVTKAFNNLLVAIDPPYLSEHCIPVSSADARRHLRSANRHLLAVPRFWLNTYGRQAFSIAGPMAWNSLPDFIRDPTSSTDCFRRLLKTYLFARY